MRVTIRPSRPCGQVRLPASKSVSHRAAICAALAEGESCLRGMGESADITATLRALSVLGASAEQDGGLLRMRGMAPPAGEEPLCIDCGESGSTLRFLIPLASLLGRTVRLTGHGRLLERPQTVYRKLFSERGLLFEHTPEAVVLKGPLPPGEYRMQGGVSSQFITGMLLVLPLLDGDSRLEILPPFESASYVELTLQVMRAFGVTVRQEGMTFLIPGRQKYAARDFSVEGDYSQMAFFAVLGALCGSIDCIGVRADSCQGDRVIGSILASFGAVGEEIPDGWRFSRSALTARDIDLADCPDLGPILMVLAARAEGTTRIYNAGRLRIKESDRIAAMEEELRKCGVEISSTEDTVTVCGQPSLCLPPCTLFCHNDHRIAMSLAVLAAATPGGPITLDGAECVRKSYPDFFEDLAALGVAVERKEDC